MSDASGARESLTEPIKRYWKRGRQTYGKRRNDLVGSIDRAVGALPGGMAGLGIALFVLAILFLFSGFSITYGGRGFLITNRLVRFVVLGLTVLGLNLQFGDTGVVNFGPVLFVALGAYATAIATATTPPFGMGFGLPWIVGVVSGVVVAMLVGGFLGLSTLRLRDDYLAVTTLAAAEIFHSIIRSYPQYFGGNKGITNLPNPVRAVAISKYVRYLAIALLFLALLFVVYEGIRRLSDSPYGRVLRAILSDEDAARSLGKNPFVYKMQVFVYGAAIAGLGGALMALFQGNAAPGSVTIDLTIILWLGMMLGGPGNHRGAVGGVGLLLLFQYFFSTRFKGQIPFVGAVEFNALQSLLLGLLFVLIIRYRPAGIWGEQERLEVFK